MKTVFKRLISSLLLVVMLVAMIPASIVSADAGDIDWEALKNKYGLTDEQIDAAKDIADEYDLTQDQVDAVEDYYESLPPEEKEELKETVKDAVEKGEIPEIGSAGGDVATNMVKAMFIATMKKAAKDVLNRVMDAMEDVTVSNVFDFDRVYENGSLAGINFVLKSPENLDVVDTIQMLADRYSVMDALAVVAGGVLMFDEVSVNGYTVYNLADPSEVWNALVEIYRANPIAFTTIANMEGNVVATYNFSLVVGDLAIDLPVSFVLECSDARLNQIKSTAQKLADRVEVNGDFTAEDGIFSADLEGILDVSDYTDAILECFLPAVLADEYALVREKLHKMPLNDFIDQLKLENLEIVADKLGYSAQFEALVEKVAAYFHLDTAEPNDLKALVKLLDAKGLFPQYIKAGLQKADSALNLSEKLNVTVGALYNGDGSYTSILGDGVDPVSFDSYMDRVFDKLLNSKYEDRIEGALKIRGYDTAEDLVNALKARYNTIYTGKYDLDVTFTLILFKTYTVTFVDEQGNVISTQEVVAGDGAADPVYHGGDVLNVNYTTSDNYDKVMEDMTVTLYPIHELKVEYTPDADCLNDGVKRTYCTVSGCDYEVEECVPAHGHDYEAVVTAPTCTEDGYTTYTCTVCGDSYVDDIVAALGHEWSDWIVIVQPTDTQCGVKIRRCYSCGCEERATFGHDYEAVVTAPTCTEEGYTTYTCSRCGDSYVDDTVAALGHDYVLTKKVDPACKDDGKEIYTCSRCGDSYEKVLPAIGHDYEAVVTAPTCTEEGYTTHTCSRCGDSYVDNTVAALGHDYVLTEKLDPTREDDGYEIHTCSRCGDSQKKVLPAIGNDDPDAGDKGVLVFVVLAFVAVAGIAIVSKAKMAR
ncbi:MAG: hypothetical protein IKT91_01245 [Clostridia bacterium]|nr:hypothetical protein [Clostridia bacterium]